MDEAAADHAARIESEPHRRVPAGVRTCTECGVKLSRYNPNSTCWQHAIGRPWRGPSARPRP
jgi:hypothetical protein